ncbi:gamma-glutamyltransferase [Sulfitobacter delicatus]|uniref:Glutathione hydrolase proenzyme n=1 Tax=Sulfitobacter delicatus TaxID=218672 RepID=A0A1G7XUI8_9RHOB|nr:gamma-glutamyltransferase [Sulfitobacter delicatus]SDG87811.1 gamma-glutamyltranspeptidase / glutathione hydrolase [Sulfitobacter delicatus]
MRVVSTFAGLLLAGSVSAQQAADAVAPEGTGAGVFEGMSERVTAALAAKAEGRPVVAQNWMVAAANPHAVEVGADVLARGGTAADALVAVQAMLGLVEPQSSGLGGGAFLVWYDAASGEVTTLDGRETAPLAATPQLFQDGAGEPLKFFDAVVGGLSVGTPGTPALMAEAHDRWGNQDWGALLAPAADLAEAGFAVSPRLAELVAGDVERLSTAPDTAAYFLPDGEPIKAGAVLLNPAYAETLRAFAAEGAAVFYGGEIGKQIVAAVQAAEQPGVLSEVDLAIYRVKERGAVCAEYRGHEVCGMGPPSSGAVAVGQILGLLEGFDLSAGPQDAEVLRLIGDASRLAFADRGRYLADHDFVPVPVTGLLGPGYLSKRAELLKGDDALPEVAPGAPEFDHALNWADDEAIELPSTSHVSIVDAMGNVASMTTTIENGFGSRVMAAGFLLNNELTDFSFRSHADGVPIANRVEPGKRPRSSMAPTIVLKDGAPVLALGSPGGSRIIGYVAGAIMAHLDWGMDVQQAVAAPHAVNRFGTFDLEEGSALEAIARPLQDIGFETNLRALTSGLHMIEISDDLRGGADPRREGIALGE